MSRMSGPILLLALSTCADGLAHHVEDDDCVATDGEVDAIDKRLLQAQTKETVTNVSSMPEVFKKMINAAVQNSPRALVVGLFRSRLFSDAVRDFARNSNFLEQMLLQADLLTKALCGFQAKSHLSVGKKGYRVNFGEWLLRIQAMKCDDECRAQLEHEVKEKSGAYEGTWVSGAVDMPALLSQPGMTELFLKELAMCPGLHEGLTPERLSTPFSKLTILAQPELPRLFGRKLPKTVAIKVWDMQTKEQYKGKVWEAQKSKIAWLLDGATRVADRVGGALWSSKGSPPDPASSDDDDASKIDQKIAEAIANLPSDHLRTFLSSTLSGFAKALVTPEVMLAPEFPLLLNAALEPAQMDLLMEHILSAGADMAFNMEEPPRKEICIEPSETDEHFEDSGEWETYSFWARVKAGEKTDDDEWDDMWTAIDAAGA